MKAKKYFAAAAGAAMAFSLAACAGSGAGTEEEPTTGATGSTDSSESAAPAEGGLVGVSMPTQTSERWIADGDAVE